MPNREIYFVLDFSLRTSKGEKVSPESPHNEDKSHLNVKKNEKVEIEDVIYETFTPEMIVIENIEKPTIGKLEIPQEDAVYKKRDLGKIAEKLMNKSKMKKAKGSKVSTKKVSKDDDHPQCDTNPPEPNADEIDKKDVETVEEVLPSSSTHETGDPGPDVILNMPADIDKPSIPNGDDKQVDSEIRGASVNVSSDMNVPRVDTLRVDPENQEENGRISPLNSLVEDNFNDTKQSYSNESLDLDIPRVEVEPEGGNISAANAKEESVVKINTDLEVEPQPQRSNPVVDNIEVQCEKSVHSKMEPIDGLEDVSQKDVEKQVFNNLEDENLQMNVDEAKEAQDARPQDEKCVEGQKKQLVAISVVLLALLVVLAFLLLKP